MKNPQVIQDFHTWCSLRSNPPKVYWCPFVVLTEYWRRSRSHRAQQQAAEGIPNPQPGEEQEPRSRAHGEVNEWQEVQRFSSLWAKGSEQLRNWFLKTGVLAGRYCSCTPLARGVRTDCPGTGCHLGVGTPPARCWNPCLHAGCSDQTPSVMLEGTVPKNGAHGELHLYPTGTWSPQKGITSLFKWNNQTFA